MEEKTILFIRDIGQITVDMKPHDVSVRILSNPEIHIPFMQLEDNGDNKGMIRVNKNDIIYYK